MKNQMFRTQPFRGLFTRLVPIALLAVLLSVAPFHAALAQVAPPLGAAQSFAVLAGSTVTSTGPSTVIGDLGVYPLTAVTGFPPGTVTGGAIYRGVPPADQAQADTTTAYNMLAGEPCGFNLTSQDLGGMTLAPAVYCFNSSAALTGALFLDAQGDPNAVWVFQIVSTLTTSNVSSVHVINGGQQYNVFWQVGSSATLGIGSSFVGNILAFASITLPTGATMSGRALARNGAVTLDANTVVLSAPTVGPPSLGKAFSPATIRAGNVSTLTITLNNPNASVANLSAPLTDTFPVGVVIAASPNAATTCTGTGAVIAVAGGTSVTLPATRSIPANGSCRVTVNVTPAHGGSYFNTLPAGALQTSNGSNAGPAVATLTVPQPAAVMLGKAFSPDTIDAGDASTLTITLSNPNASVANLSAPLTDTLPIGVVIAAIPTTNCGGPLTGNIGDGAVTLTTGSIPANGSCTVTVSVTAPIGGSYLNTLAAGALQTSNGSNAAPAVATLTVPPPASITLGKTFSPATIDPGDTSTLTISLRNNNVTVATLSAPLTDTLPIGVVIAASPNAATTCTGTGAVIAVAGGTSVTLPATRSIPTDDPCTVTVDVTAPLGGSYFNTLAAGALQTSNGSNAAPAVATLTVPQSTAVILGKAFSPATIVAGRPSTVTITLFNPSARRATLTAPLTDTLPIGVVIAAIRNAGSTCGGSQALIAPAGGTTVTLPAARWIPANSSCIIKFDVTAPIAGSYFNTLATGAFQTSNGSNAAPAIATLTVTPAPILPTLTNSFTPATINARGVSILTITLSNANGTPAALTTRLVDYITGDADDIWPDSDVWIAASPNAATTCTGTGALIARAGTTWVVLPVTRSIPANGSCTVTVNVTARTPGSYVNRLPAGALKSNKGNNAAPATATLTVTP